MADSGTMRERIDAGALDGALIELYCRDRGALPRQRERWLKVAGAFEETFGATDRVGLYSAPGRTELGGNHTDHQHGCVLAGSVTLDMIAAAAPNRDSVIRLHSDGYPVEEVSLDHLKPDPDEFNTTRSLVRGVAARFREVGHGIGGFDACMSSNVLPGSGLSSSAAFEVLIGVILNHLYCGGRVSAVEVAKIGRYAENVYFGKPCGLMDQLACSVGGALFIDFRDMANPAIQPVDLDLAGAGYAMCIIDTGADHAGMSGIYAEIPEEMNAVAASLGHSRLRGAEKADLLAEVPRIRAKVGDRAFLRALHFFNENRRAVEETEALRRGDFGEFLSLVNASGVSSWTCLQNITLAGAIRNQEMAATLALCGELLAGKGAWRVHGGGFAGTVQAFVPLAMRDEFVGRLSAWLGEGRCHVLSIRKAGGVRVA